MPYPRNVETARDVEAIVREAGAVPATIAILDGVCCIGLSDDELNRFAKLGDAGQVGKVSRRDLAACIARCGHGGTTVSTTMLLADMAGISTFVTGGIGGVHRGGELSMDVSADLCELGRTPVCVVCAGAKSILDIPRTLEFLETQGVAVLALGVDEFPAFFTRSSGCKAPIRIETPEEAATVAQMSEALGLRSGMLVGVPIPEEAEAEASVVQAAIAQALDEADAQAIGGQKITPFLLKRIAELSEGKSLASNIALIKNNALVGSQLALALAAKKAKAALHLRGGGGGAGMGGAATGSGAPADSLGGGSNGRGSGRPVVVGGSVTDLVASPVAGTCLIPRTSSPGTLMLAPGGVGRNIAEGLARLGAEPLLLTAVGDDAFGEQLLAHAAELSAAGTPFHSDGVRLVEGGRTATYTAVMDETNDLCAAVADMGLHEHISAEYIRSFSGALATTPLCVADANLADAALEELARQCAALHTPLWLEPVSVPKGAAACRSLSSAGLLGAVAFVSPNEDEATAMAAALDDAAPPPSDVRAAAAALVRAGCRHVLVTRGAQGVLWAHAEAAGDEQVAYEELPALAVSTVLSTRGAGDAFVAGAVWALTAALTAAPDALEDATVRAAIHCGLRAARLALLTEAAVPTDLSPDLVASAA